MFIDKDRNFSQSQQGLPYWQTSSAGVGSAHSAQMPLGDILRMTKALAKTGMKRTSFLNLQDPKSPYFDPTFPKRIRLGARCVGWAENELEAYLLARKNSSIGGAQ